MVPGKISPSTGKLTISNNKAIFTVSSSTTTMELSNGPASRSTAGNCEYGNTKDCPEWDNHHVTWSLGDKYSGISIDANTGLLTVKRNSLSRTDTDIVIIARAGGKDGVPVTEVKGYMTVRKGSSSLRWRQ